MNNAIDNNINKGVELLNEAMNLYEDGNIKDAYKTYKDAGKFLSEANNMSQTNDGKISMIYGGNRNFGMIYKIFESNTRDLLKNKSNTNKLNKIIKYIKENKVLMNEFSTYNAFTNPTNVDNAQEYVNEAMSLVKHYNAKTLRENNEKLINMFKEYKLNENVSVSDDEVELYESIEYMLLHPKSYNNIGKYNEIQKKLCEFVSDNNTVITEGVDIDKLYNEKVNEIVNKHENILNEDEMRLIKDITTNDKKAKEVFESNKREAIKMLMKEIDNNEDNSEWNTLLENVQGRTYSKENALSDIIKFMELQSTLSE